MLYLHRSNRTEELLRVLLELVRRPSGSPLEPETLVVQGPGMERWLAQRLASAFGVWAHPDVPFPRRFVESTLEAALGPPEVAWEPERVAWALADLLPERLAEPAFASVARYLEADADGRRRFELAYRVADLFDHYALYRPTLVTGWREGRGGGT